MGFYSRHANPVIISVDQEEPYARVRRWIAIVLVGAGLVAIASLPPSWTLRTLGYMVAGIVLAHAVERLGMRRSLVMRDQDLFTRGGEIDRPVRWSRLSAIIPTGCGLELVDHDGNRRQLSFHFLPALQREVAIQRILRYFQLFQREGPMDLAYPKKLEVDGEVRMQLASSQDLDLWVELAISPENAAHQLTRGNTREMAQAVAPAAVAVDGDSVGFARYTIMTGEQRAGFLTVYLEDPVLRHAKLGIDLLPEFWGRGYGTRAVTAIIKFLTGETNVIKVSAGCFSDNARCRRVLEKAGLEHCGSFSRFWMKAGEWKAGEHYELDLLKRRPARAITPERTISETDPAVAACLEPAV